MYSLYAYQSGFFHLSQYILDSTIWYTVISTFIFIAEQYSTVQMYHSLYSLVERNLNGSHLGQLGRGEAAMKVKILYEH